MTKEIIMEQIAHHTTMMSMAEGVQDRTVALAYKSADLPVTMRQAEQVKLTDQYNHAQYLIDVNEKKISKLRKKLKKLEK